MKGKTKMRDSRGLKEQHGSVERRGRKGPRQGLYKPVSGAQQATKSASTLKCAETKRTIPRCVSRLETRSISLQAAAPPPRCDSIHEWKRWKSVGGHGRRPGSLECRGVYTGCERVAAEKKRTERSSWVIFVLLRRQNDHGRARELFRGGVQSVP